MGELCIFMGGLCIFMGSLCIFLGPATGQAHSVTAEDLELHNQAEGAWSIIRGKVYNIEDAQVSLCQCQ